MAWLRKWYRTNKDPLPVMALIQDKLHALTSQQTNLLAEELGVSKITLFNWRTGHVKFGSGYIMSTLCIHFGLLPGELPSPTDEEKAELAGKDALVPPRRKPKRERLQPRFKVHAGGRR